MTPEHVDYVEIDPDAPEPVCKCMNCGGWSFDQRLAPFCSKECEEETRVHFGWS